MADLRLRRDILWNLAPVVLLGVVGLGLHVAIAQWWGAAALGVFNLVTIAYFVLAVAGAFGLQYSVLRAIAEAPADRAHVAAVVVGALVPVTGLAAVAAGGFLLAREPVARLFGSDGVAIGMTWAAPGLFCFAVNKVLFNVVNGLRRMRAFAVYTSLRYALIGVGLVLARAVGLAPARLAAVWTFVEGTMLIVLAVELVMTVPLHRGAGWRRWTRAHLAYGVRGLPATLAYEVNTKLDVWMVGAAGFSTAQVGVYSIAAAFNEGATQLSVAVQNNVNPMCAELLARGDLAGCEALVRRTRRWFVPAMVGACALGAAAFPLVIPRATGDAQFAAGAVPFAILMAGLALASPWLPFGQLLLMGDRPAWHTVLMLAVVAIAVIANLVLIPLAGIAGAACATSTAVVAAALLVRVLARGKLGVRL